MKKKKDVTSKEVTALLLLREDPLASFAEEVLQMDPSLNSFVGVFVADRDCYSVRMDNATEADNNKAILVEFFRNEGLYKDLDRTEEQVAAWNQYVNTKSDSYAQKRNILEAYHKALQANVVLAKVPGYKRGGIDDLIRLSRTQRLKTQAIAKKRAKGKGKEKASTSGGDIAPPSENELKENEQSAKEAEARNLRLTEFKKDIPISNEFSEKVYGTWYERLFQPVEDETAAKAYKDRILDPLWNKITDDRDDIVVYIVSLDNFISTYEWEDISQYMSSGLDSKREVLSTLELAIEEYNLRRPRFWPVAKYTS